MRRLPSGKFQARYRAHGKLYTAPITFPTKTDAGVYLKTVEADLIRDVWRAPMQTDETIAEYGARWIRDRSALKNSTREQYAADFRLHIETRVGDVQVQKLTPDQVRRWNGELRRDLAAKLAARSDRRKSTATTADGTATAARCYRLLRTIMGTAVEDGVVAANPCQMKGAGTVPASDRPTLSVGEVARLADSVPGHYRAFVLMAAWTGIRAGELAALRRRDFELGEFPTVRVEERMYQLAGGGLDFDLPKSRAGARTVSLPAFLATEVGEHLDAFTDEGADALVFTTTGGRPLARGAYGDVVRRGLHKVGRPDVRVHDLRHTGQTFAALAGASMAELMQRMGHSTTSAAAIYLHTTTDHGRAVADQLSEIATGGDVVHLKPNRRRLRTASGS